MSNEKKTNQLVCVFGVFFLFVFFLFYGLIKCIKIIIIHITIQLAHEHLVNQN